MKDITVTVPANTIGSVTIPSITSNGVTSNAVTASVVGTTATLYNVGVNVPGDASGVNVPVQVSLVCVNASGGCSGISNTAVNVTITTLTFNDGSAVQTVTPSGSNVTATSYLVASAPTVSMTSSSGSGFVNGNQQIGTFTVTANAAGNIKIEQIPITISVSGSSTITANSVELKDSTGNTVLVGTSTAGVNGDTALSGSGNFVFSIAGTASSSTWRTITAGTSETYTVWATFSGVTGGSNTMNETFGLGPKANFKWDDVIGGVSDITGAYFNTYPSNTQTKTN